MTINQKTGPHAPDDRRLDRLVDDELDEEDRRRLLARLESQPDGWRRCAMAFLEAQAWRHAMTRLAEDTSTGQAERRPARGADLGRVDSGTISVATEDGRSFPWYATAACVLAAFTLGVVSQLAVSGYRVDPQPPIAASDVADSRSSTDDRIDVAGTPIAQQGRPETRVGPDRLRGSEPEADVDFFSPSPVQMIEAFRRRGHQVHRQRGIVPFQLEDGRQGFVPVEDLYVVPAKLTTY